MNFEYSDNYAIKFGDFTEAVFQHRMFANDLIVSWTSLAESCAKPYNDVLEEFLHDVSSLRDLIQMCIDEATLNEFEDHQIFKTKIDLLDKIFIDLTQEHPEWRHFPDVTWWEKRIPKKVTRAFFYGIDEEYLTNETSLYEVVD